MILRMKRAELRQADLNESVVKRSVVIARPPHFTTARVLF